jgi:dynein intermediate chain 2
MSEREANTEAVVLATKVMNHVEGGWPKDIDYSEAEHTIRCAACAAARSPNARPKGYARPQLTMRVLHGRPARRYRKKVEKDEDYIHTVAALGGAVEDLVKQNNVVDIYEEYFTGVATDHSAEVPNVKTVTVFKDPSPVPRSASYVNWHPDSSVPKVVISYSILQVWQWWRGQKGGCLPVLLHCVHWKSGCRNWCHPPTYSTLLPFLFADHSFSSSQPPCH